MHFFLKRAESKSNKYVFNLIPVNNAEKLIDVVHSFSQPSIIVYISHGAEDCEYYDYNNGNITDILLTDGCDGLALLNGATGEVVWNTYNYGHSDSVLFDVDYDGKLEVLATILEHVAVIEAQTGLIKFSKTLDFYFDRSNISVVDLYSNGTDYIFATSFYCDTFLFSLNFDLVECLPNVPPGWVYSYLFYDLLNYDGILEFFGGCFTGSNAVFAYVFDGLFPHPSFLLQLLLLSLLFFSFLL